VASETVLVPGGSGFVGVHVVAALLQAGYPARATLRSLGREGDVRRMLARAGLDGGTSQLSFAEADLLRDEGWAAAVRGCRFVHHVASPFPLGVPKHEDELLAPAREGTLRVLRAARAAGVERVVLTSSVAAVAYGVPERAEPFTEQDWSNPDGPGITAYAKSKTLAERAAWEYVRGEGAGLELAVVNPVGIFGPALGPDLSTSVVIVKELLEGSVPGMPNIWFGAVDVRDVASLHLLAMTRPEAAGERFLAVAGHFVAAVEVAKTLKRRMGAAAKRTPVRVLPDALVKVAALFNPAARQVVPELGKRKDASAAKAERVLGWQPRSAEESIVASAQSLVDLGLVKA
jgi:nucleoside-diphosphate-sugar epimerase